MRVRNVNTYRPRLTDQEVAALAIGSKVRDIPGGIYEVIAFADGKDGSSLAVMAYWSQRHHCWKHVVVASWELQILYTPLKMPKP